MHRRTLGLFVSIALVAPLFAPAAAALQRGNGNGNGNGGGGNPSKNVEIYRDGRGTPHVVAGSDR